MLYSVSNNIFLELAESPPLFLTTGNLVEMRMIIVEGSRCLPPHTFLLTNCFQLFNFVVFRMTRVVEQFFSLFLDPLNCFRNINNNKCYSEISHRWSYSDWNWWNIRIETDELFLVHWSAYWTEKLIDFECYNFRAGDLPDIRKMYNITLPSILRWLKLIMFGLKCFRRIKFHFML